MNSIKKRLKRLESEQAAAAGSLYVYYQQMDRPSLYRSQTSGRLLSRGAVGRDVGATDEDIIIVVEYETPAALLAGMK